MGTEKKTCGECRFFESKEFICCHTGDDVAEHFIACSDFEPLSEQKPTNGDVIRQMSNGTFAYMMTRLILEGCPISKSKTRKEMHECKISNDCTNCLKQWLNAPAKSNTESEG